MKVIVRDISTKIILIHYIHKYGNLSCLPDSYKDLKSICSSFFFKEKANKS